MAWAQYFLKNWCVADFVYRLALAMRTADPQIICILKVTPTPKWPILENIFFYILVNIPKVVHEVSPILAR